MPIESRDILSIWTLYDHPRDHPQHFIARRHEIAEGGSKPTNDILVSASLDRLRTQMQQRGLFKLPREDGDDPVIVESWI